MGAVSLPLMPCTPCAGQSSAASLFSNGSHHMWMWLTSQVQVTLPMQHRQFHCQPSKRQLAGGQGQLWNFDYFYPKVGNYKAMCNSSQTRSNSWRHFLLSDTVLCLDKKKTIGKFHLHLHIQQYHFCIYNTFIHSTLCGSTQHSYVYQTQLTMSIMNSSIAW